MNPRNTARNLLPPALLYLGFACGCGETPVRPLPAPGLPHLSGVIKPPAGLWLEDPASVEVAPDGRLFVQEGVYSYGCGGQVMGETRVAVLNPGGDIEAQLPVPLDRYAVTENRIFAVRWWEQRVEVYDHSGTHLSGFALESAQPVNFPFEFDVAASADGRVYILDPALRRVQGFSEEGRLLVTWGERGAGPAQMEVPSRIVVDGQGNVYVLDIDMWRVQKFSPDGAVLRVWDLVHSVQFGALLEGDLTVDGRNRPIVLDWSVDDDPGRVIVLAADGGEAMSWRLPVGSEPGAVNYPWAIAARGDNEILFVDRWQGRLARFSAAGEFLGTLGRPYGSEPGELLSVSALAAVPDGSVIVLDSRTDRLERYAPDGTRLGVWPSPSIQEMGWMAAAADGNLWLASTTYGNNRVIQVSPSGAILHDWKLGLEGGGGGLIYATGPPKPAGYEYLKDMAIAPSDMLAFLVYSSTSGLRIELRTADGQHVRNVAAPGAWQNMAVDADWRGWLSDYEGNLEILNLLTGKAEPFQGLQGVPGGAGLPTRIAFDGPGNIYLLAWNPVRVLLFDRLGVFAGEFGREDLAGIESYSRYGPPFAVSADGTVAVATGEKMAVVFRP